MEYVAKTNKQIYFRTEFIMLMIRIALTVGCFVAAFFLEPIPKFLLWIASAALIIHAVITLLQTLPAIRAERPVVLREKDMELLVKGKRLTVQKSEVQGIAFRRVSNALDGGTVVVHLGGSKSHSVPYVADLTEVRAAADKLGYKVSFLD